MIYFKVIGEPVGKGRPRFTRAGTTYTPRKTAEYESLVRLEYERQCSGLPYPKGIPIKMEINAFFGIPRSTGVKSRERMRSGEIRPTKKPDVDNIAKIIADSLNGIAYHDDAQIVSCTVHKRYSSEPRVEVSIGEV